MLIFISLFDFLKAMKIIHLGKSSTLVRMKNVPPIKRKKELVVSVGKSSTHPKNRNLSPSFPNHDQGVCGFRIRHP